jgi:cation:H+ antiporter
MTILWIGLFVVGVALIVWGAESFAEHLGTAAVRLGVSSFALALLLAGAEPEELATVIAAGLHGTPGIAFGDVIGANVTICLVALGVGAWIAPLPFRGAVMLYAALGLPLGALGTWLAWDGSISRIEGAGLVALYAAYVTIIWIAERRPPMLGETGEIEEAREQVGSSPSRDRVGLELLRVGAGLAAMAIGASLLVEGVERLASIESTQTKLGLTLVGFATGFELVVLAWSAARRGASEAAVAGVVGSFAYNVTMTLGAGALVRPLRIQNSVLLHGPLLAMVAALSLVVVLARRAGQLTRRDAAVLLAGYPLFVVLVMVL